MSKVYGFDERSFNRVREATRMTLGTPRTGSQRRRQVPIVGGGGGGGGGSTLTDGCECNKTFATEGATLFGGPTVCCKGHQRWTIDLGPVLGTFTLYHVGGDIWSTFNEDEELDNPYVVSCYPEESDLYDLVMELTPTGATITLAPRDELNCDLVCFQYVRSDLFSCQSANQFKRGYFENARSLELPLCVCVVPAAGFVSECKNICDISDSMPEFLEATISGVTTDCTDNETEGFGCGCIVIDPIGPVTEGVKVCNHRSNDNCEAVQTPNGEDCPDPDTPVDCSSHNGAFLMRNTALFMEFGDDCTWTSPADYSGYPIPAVSYSHGTNPSLQVIQAQCGVCDCFMRMIGRVSSLIGNTEPIDCSQPLVFDTWTPVNPGQTQCCDWSGATATVRFPGVNPPEGSGHCTSPCAPEAE